MADKTQNVRTRLSFDGEAEYKAACKEINSTLKVLNSEMKLVTAEYRDNANSAEALRAKQSVLQRTYDEQEKKVRETEQALERCRQATGENSEESKRLETQLNHQKAALVRTGQELNRTSDELENAENAANELGEEIEESGQQAEDAGEKFSGLGGILSGIGGTMAKGVAVIGTAAVAIGTAVVAGLGYAVSQADEAKGALNDFCAATGTATDEAGEYKKVMENIYNANFGGGFEDIAAAMSEVRQQAGDLGANELEKMTTNALTLRDTFDFDVAESTRAATQLMQKFGLSSDEAYNLIAQGAQNGLNKNGDLLDVINEYSNQYSQAGLSAEDMFNSIANGASTGVWSIDKMGDAFKEFSIRMNDGTANDYLKSLGINADEVVGKFQKGGESAKEAMRQVSEALKNCDDKTLQYTAGVGLMGTMWEDMGADACTSLMDVEGQISKTTDAMGKINNIKYDTFSEAMQGAGRILQTSFIMPIGEQALPIFSEFANALQKGATEANGDIGKLAKSFGEALGNMVNGLAEMLPQMTSFAAELVTGIADGIVESMPVIVQAGTNMIISLTEGITGTTTKIAETAVEVVSTLIRGLTRMLPTLVSSAGEIIASIANGIGKELPNLLPVITRVIVNVVEELINNIPMLVDAALQLITGLAEGIIAALPILIDAIPEIIEAIINALVTGLPMIIESAGDIIIALADGLIEAIPVLVEVLPQIIEEIVMGLTQAAPQILQASITLFMKLVEAIPQIVMELAAALPQIIEAVATALANAIPQVYKCGKEMLGTIVKAIPDVVAKLKEAVPNIVTGIANGLVNGVKAVYSAAKKLGTGILNGIKEFFGIHSPSTVMTEQGDYLVQGLINGISEMPQRMAEILQNAVKKVMEWGSNMISKAVEVTANMVTGIANIAIEVPQKIWNGIVGAVAKVATWGSNITQKAKEVTTNMVTGAVNIAKEIPTKIYNSISGAISKVATWGTEIKNKAVEGMRSAINGITSVFSNIGSTFASFGKYMVEGIWTGISNTTQWIKDKISGWVGNVTNFLKNLFGIASPSKLMRDEIGVYLAQGIGVGFTQEIQNVNKMIEDSIPKEFDVGTKVKLSKSIEFDSDGEKQERKKGSKAAGGITVIQNIYANTTDYAKQQREAARQFKMIARTV